MDKFLIGDFEGPLDLLLHLVKQSKIEIENLKLVDITKQYLNFLNEMKQMNLDIASSYLVVASELIEMKSRFLLPRNKKEEKIDELEDNPEEELKCRLLEYQKYKDSVSIFRELEEKRTSYFTKTPEKIDNYVIEKLTNTEGLTSINLLEALENLLKRIDYSKPLNTKITKKEISVNDKITKIRNILKINKTIEFISLFEEITKEEIVITFLGILEMAKNKEIFLRQNKNFDTIILERVDDL